MIKKLEKTQNLTDLLKTRKVSMEGARIEEMPNLSEIYCERKEREESYGYEMKEEEEDEKE